MLLLVNCSNDSNLTNGEEVVVSLLAEGVKLANFTSSKISYFLIDQETAAIVDWIPTCHSDYQIDAYRSKTVKYNDIMGFTPGKNIIVYYWECPLQEDLQISNIVLSF